MHRAVGRTGPPAVIVLHRQGGAQHRARCRGCLPAGGGVGCRVQQVSPVVVVGHLAAEKARHLARIGAPGHRLARTVPGFPGVDAGHAIAPSRTMIAAKAGACRGSSAACPQRGAVAPEQRRRRLVHRRRERRPTALRSQPARGRPSAGRSIRRPGSLDEALEQLQQAPRERLGPRACQPPEVELGAHQHGQHGHGSVVHRPGRELYRRALQRVCRWLMSCVSPVCAPDCVRQGGPVGVRRRRDLAEGPAGGAEQHALEAEGVVQEAVAQLPLAVLDGDAAEPDRYREIGPPGRMRAQLIAAVVAVSVVVWSSLFPSAMSPPGRIAVAGARAPQARAQHGPLAAAAAHAAPVLRRPHSCSSRL